MPNSFNLKKWFQFGLISLLIVALFGTTMRYKIAFNFPYLEQKNLLHAHSFFGFNGWISHIIYCGLAYIIFPYLPVAKQKKYYFFIAANLICAFISLVAFTILGYKLIAILLSSLVVFVNIFFTIAFIKDSKLLPKENTSKPWAIAGLLLNVLSAVGPACLAYIILSKNFSHNFYLGSVYYHLHFQQNGWFFFGGMAMVASILPKNFPSLKKYFNAFILTVIPAFLLSILWAKLPIWLYVIAVIAVVIQFIAWMHLVYTGYTILRKEKINNTPKWVNIFFYAAALALTIKFILQTISVIPSLSQMVYGFRPIIIAYIHLILLGVFSLFIIGYMFYRKFLLPTVVLQFATISFLIGVILNELILSIQGFAALTYTPVPYINEILFGVALILFISILLVNIFRKSSTEINA